MKGYKGFEKGLICNPSGKKPFQFAENEIFEQKNDAKICESGFHFCPKPLDVLEYYPPCDVYGNLNEFAEIEALDKTLTDDNVKYCTKKIKIGAKIGLVGLIKAEVEYIKQQIKAIKDENKVVNSGYSSAAVNSGDSSAAVNSGDSSAAVNSGYRSAAVNSGDSSAAVNSGDRSAAVNSGDRSAAVNSGKEGVAIALGIDGKAKAALGGWIVLTEWEYTDSWHRIDLKSIQVDGTNIKADTFYKLVNGEFIEQE